jgi:putative PIN family toxin of toxin-antitoxin system
MERCKIIIDTNLWISLLIGKRLSEMRELCNNARITAYFCEELVAEFLRIANSKKIRKYATDERIKETVSLIRTSCVNIFIKNTAVSPQLRDAKDLYLLSLADTVRADYILTGDNDLLVLKFHNYTKIVTYNEFKVLVAKWEFSGN